jgi:hypothetical protein
MIDWGAMRNDFGTAHKFIEISWKLIATRQGIFEREGASKSKIGK